MKTEKEQPAEPAEITEETVETVAIKKRWNRLTVAVNVCRGLLALTFLFSGFVKANDPIGTQIKLNEYLRAMGLDSLTGLTTLAAALGLAFVEFTLGVYLVIGQRRRTVSLVTVIIMAVMTALTLWIAIANPVSDCGCFGDAIVLSNGMTLAKNVVLLAAAVVVMRWYRKQPPLVHGGWAWLVTTLFPVGILVFAVYCIVALPLIDFRPYKVGVNLAEHVGGGSVHPQVDVKIVYQRGDETLILGIDDDDPDSTWTYVETRRETSPAPPTKEGNNGLKEEDVLELRKFYIFNPMLDEDITEEVIMQEGYTLLLIAPNLDTADQGCAGDINELYDFALQHDIPFYCLTASDETAQQRWTDYTGAEYTYLESDEQVLQTMVRANPGLVLLKDGVIVHKWSNWKIPTEI